MWKAQAEETHAVLVESANLIEKITAIVMGVDMEDSNAVFCALQDVQKVILADVENSDV